MPSDDYTSAVGGGLRLKGVKDAKIDKHKKKKRKAPEGDAAAAATKESASAGAASEGDGAAEREAPGGAPEDEGEGGKQETGGGEGPAEAARKTEAERRYEERRRKRVGSRLSMPLFSFSRVKHALPACGRVADFAGRDAVGRAAQARGRQDAQGARRGAESVPEQSERAPRHVGLPPTPPQGRLCCDTRR
jgi:protein FAM32A